MKVFKIKDIGGKEHEIECIACALQIGKIELPVEQIAETENFVVEQDLEVPIEGFLIIRSKRHLRSIAELNKEENEELSEFLYKTRKAMRDILNIRLATIMQEETSENSHFHVWLFPWHEWILKKWKGKAHEMKEVMQYAKEKMMEKENLELVKKSAANLKQYYGN